MTVWPIIKKDWRLLWPVVGAVAVVQMLLALARFLAGHFVNLPAVPTSLLQLFAVTIVMALLVLQDPIPGVRHDWLVRPIPRGELLLAKVLFALVLVQGPWWASDVIQGIANGFSLAQSTTAATTSALWVFVALSLPVLAFTGMTSSITEALIGALSVFVVLIAFLLLPTLLSATRPAAVTGFAWVSVFLREAILAMAAMGALLLLYRGRHVVTARVLFAGALIVGQSLPLMPWRTTVRVDAALTARAVDDHAITVAFAPAAGRFRLAPGQGIDDVAEKPGVGAVDAAEETRKRRAEGVRTVFLPIQIAGLVTNSRLLADRSEMTFRTADGRAIYRGTGNDLELRAAASDAVVHQGIRLPGAMFSQHHAEPLRVDLEYWWTTFLPTATYTLPARDGDQRMPGIGWCATKIDESQTSIVVRCLQPGERPSCVTLRLDHPPTRAHNPELSLCAPDYSPYRGHVLPDALSRFGGRLPFYDPSGAMRYPVGGAQLSEARVLVEQFRLAAHLTRQITIPRLRLDEWEPEPAISGTR